MRQFFAGIGIAMVVVSTMFGTAAALPAPVAKAECVDRYFMIPTWYKGLQIGDCTGVGMKTQEEIPKFITILVMNIVQALLVVAAYIAIFFVIRGGFGYMTSAGSSEGMASAKKTITNALIGLVIAILSASIVNAIAAAIP